MDYEIRLSEHEQRSASEYDVDFAAANATEQRIATHRCSAISKRKNKQTTNNAEFNVVKYFFSFAYMCVIRFWKSLSSIETKQTTKTKFVDNDFNDFFSLQKTQIKNHNTNIGSCMDGSESIGSRLYDDILVAILQQKSRRSKRLYVVVVF